MKSNVLLPALASASIAWAIPAPGPKPTAAPILDKRQQHPFSLSSVIPSEVDTRFYTTDGSTTKFIGSNSAYLSVPTVTGTSDGQTITTTETASMGIYTVQPQGSGETEYNVVLAPALANEVQKALSTTSKRDLEERALPALITTALVELLGPKMAISILEVANLAVTEAGLASVAGGIVALGEFAVPAAAFLMAVVNQFSLLVSLHNQDSYFRAVKVPNPHENFRDAKSCPATTKCSDCGGQNLICTSGSNNKCPCQEEEEKKCKKGDEKPDCGNPNCNGLAKNVCTTGPQKDCECEVLEASIVDKVSPDGWLDKQQKILQAVVDGSGSNGDQTGKLACGTAGLQGLRNPGYVMTNDKDHHTPKDVLYMMREVLCNDKCENPAGIDTKSVKTTPNGDGCEIAVLLSANIESWAYRTTHSQGDQWQQCWDSMANATEKCTDFQPNTTGWVNGPSDYEFFQIGYRAKNSDGKLHSDFQDGDELKQWCGDQQPKCDTCYGGASGNMCTQGEFAGCACEPVTATQPPVPKVTNCATAIAAVEIICCGWSKDTQKTCRQKALGCGVDINLDAQCQSAVDPTGFNTYQTCGQFFPDQGIVRGSHMDDLATCLDKEFTLNAEFKYA